MHEHSPTAPFRTVSRLAPGRGMGPEAGLCTSCARIVHGVFAVAGCLGICALVDLFPSSAFVSPNCRRTCSTQLQSGRHTPHPHPHHPQDHFFSPLPLAPNSIQRRLSIFKLGPKSPYISFAPSPDRKSDCASKSFPQLFFTPQTYVPKLKRCRPRTPAPPPRSQPRLVRRHKEAHLPNREKREADQVIVIGLLFGRLHRFSSIQCVSYFEIYSCKTYLAFALSGYMYNDQPFLALQRIDHPRG